MHYFRRPNWHLCENQTTSESVFLNRRKFLTAVGIGGIGATLAGASLLNSAQAANAGEAFMPEPERNMAYEIGPERSMTDEALASTYNNFYEFGSHKQISQAAQRLDTTDWRIKIDGLVEKEVEINMDDLLAQMPIEERIYRHRCVEAWSMVVPWIGFELRHLLALAAPLSGAKYVNFESFQDPQIAIGQRQVWYPWPYQEGMTLAEAAHPLALMVVGVYGKVLPKQFGAPIRLHLPWKYGFKSIKSITRITLTDTQPVSFWEQLQASEYGFWANVNPEIPHRRWSQATERVLGKDGRIATLPYNGYGEDVASLYTGMEALGDALYR